MRTRSARDQAYLAIRAKILSMELLPDERIDETHLAESIGVSRTPIREAIQMLISDELIIAVPRGGYVVSNVTLGKFRSLMEAHNIVVQSVAQLLVVRATEEDFAELEAAIKAFDAAEESGTPAQVAETNANLHILEATLTRNTYLASMATKVHLHLQRLAFVSFGGYGEQKYKESMTEHFLRVSDDHWGFLAALRARDSAKALDIAVNHAQLFEQRIIDYMTSAGEVRLRIDAAVLE